MGFSLNFTTTEKISPVLQVEIRDAADVLYAKYSWVLCYGPSLQNEDGFLVCSSKLSISPDADDAADARSEGMPDGNFRTLLDCFCSLSRQFDIDWKMTHDHGGGYYIRCGRVDEELREFCDAFGDLADDFPDGV
jgi:hypothetical protein